MEDEDRKEHLGQIIPADSQALSSRSASFMQRGLRGLSGRDVAAVIEIGKALTSSTYINEIVRILTDKISELFCPDSWSLMLVDEPKQELYYECAIGKDAKALKDVRIKVGEGIPGWVVEHNQSAFVPDLTQDTRFSLMAHEKAKAGTEPIVAVPMRQHDKCVGVIEVTNGFGGVGLSPMDLGLLEAVADFAAIAIENAQHIARIGSLSLTDEQTELYNGRHLNFMIDTEIHRSERYGYQFAIVCIDIESNNDLAESVSYSAFRQLLTEVADLLRNNIRIIDSAFRLEGLEFIIVLPQTHKDSACVGARRLNRAIREITWLQKTGVNLRLTSSIGVAVFPDDARTKGDLINRACEAQQLVKNSSRDGVAAANVGLL